ncbi:GNAT family N-acetyltransferase [Nocardioides okcheonensis]|uniref:GNAT family N-acetyltransferase n=1 Tax=Nocardioides okcheonensis TaxID=2894081 RepID=UPI001E28BAFA|nr:GNAT family N-acetyltransferase [Nocardioides okcheonensis]UFN45041.1 GNAT family N-acetyltransferase [Nocardioides okcheonensis]
MESRAEWRGDISPPARLLATDFVLRAISQADWAIEAELSRDPQVVQWTHHPESMDELAARERIRHYEKRAAEGATQRFVILDDHGDSLGTCGIGRLMEETPEVFYTLLERGRGRGAATQAATALSQWATTNGCRSVALVTIEGNEPSERVALRAGFARAERFEGDHRGKPVRLTRWLRHSNAY